MELQDVDVGQIFVKAIRLHFAAVSKLGLATDGHC